MVDYQSRARYLISQAGGFRAATTKRGSRGGRRTALPRTTLTRIARGGSEPSQATKDRINRAFRRIAPDEVKRREKRTGTAGTALVDERTARGLERSFLTAGTDYKVTARAKYTRRIEGVGEPVEMTTYGRGDTVEEAKQKVEQNFAEMRRQYRNWNIKPTTKLQYRVYSEADEA